MLQKINDIDQSNFTQVLNEECSSKDSGLNMNK